MVLRARILAVLPLLILLSAVSFSQNQGSTLEIEILESFDENASSKWVARGSKFATVEYDSAGNVTEIYPVLAEVPGYPDTLFGLKSGNENRKVLGILGKFDRKGHNYIEIIPAKEADSSTAEELIIYSDITRGKASFTIPS